MKVQRHSVLLSPLMKRRIAFCTATLSFLAHLCYSMEFGYVDRQRYDAKQQRELETHAGQPRSLQIDFCGNYIELAEPKTRDGLDLSFINKAQCGGTKQGSSEFITKPNTFGFVKFHTKYSCPSISSRSYSNYQSNGLCRIRFSKEFYEDEDSYSVLFPESGLHDDEGWFNCGTAPNIFEYVKFKYPDITWDKCTLQLQHKTEDGIFYQCADITIHAELGISWEGLWLNGGSWINGKWHWSSGYGGKYWDGAGHFESQGPSFWLIVVFVVFVIALVFVFAYIIYKIINKKTPIKDKISPNNSEIDDIFGGTVFDSRYSRPENSMSFERKSKNTNEIFEINE